MTGSRTSGAAAWRGSGSTRRARGGRASEGYHSARLVTSVALGAALSFAHTAALAQEAPAPSAPAARAEDVSSVDAILAALYDVISGPAGQQRDWDRFRSLFAPGARLIPTGRRPDGSHAMRVLTPEDYVRTAGPGLERNGFFEREIGRTTEEFGGMVHVFSAYDSRRTASDTRPFARGINSIQLVNDGSRWWIVTVLWASEGPNQSIPERYLRPPGR